VSLALALGCVGDGKIPARVSGRIVDEYERINLILLLLWYFHIITRAFIVVTI
jgi:hypothetical protein